jgi:transcriptional antiterminator RfaH
MALLPQEPTLFPTDLFQRPGADIGSVERWWVFYTRARSEKALARRLYHQGVGFFLPVYQHQWLSRGKRLRSFMPLFPGYVFLFGTEDGRIKALETNLVSRCLVVTDQERLHTDLARVHYLIEAGLPLRPEDHLAPGTMVEIHSGALAGLQGKVLRRGGQTRLVVEVQMLQRGVSVEIDELMLRPIAEQQSALQGAAADL